MKVDWRVLELEEQTSYDDNWVFNVRELFCEDVNWKAYFNMFLADWLNDKMSYVSIIVYSHEKERFEQILNTFAENKR